MTQHDEGTANDVDVIIVGAGPVGSSLAIDLAMAGVRTVVLESRAADELPHPGTNLTNIRSMEHFRRWNVTEHVRAANPIGPEFARDAQFPTRGNGYLVAEIPGAFGDIDPLPFSSAKPHFGPQSSVERGLRTKLKEFPGTDLRFRATFERFDEDADGVNVRYRSADGTQHSVRGSYLVGADGSASKVRAQLGIRMEGTAGLANGTAWYIRSPAIRDLLAEHFGSAVFVWITNEDQNGLLLIAQSSEGDFQYMDVPLEDGLDGGDWDLMRARLWNAVGAELPVERVGGGQFRVNSLVAPRFHVGRVFLTGDAAHHISVVGGFGWNTGVGDVANLGWKLAAAVKGWAGPRLLGSYSAERVPVVRWTRDLTEEATKHLGSHCQPGMEEPGPEGDALRERIGALVLEDKRKEIISLGAQFGAALYDSPIIVGDGTRPPAATFGEFVPSASPGARAPHVWLGDDKSLYDQIAHSGFTLLQLGDSDVSGLRRAAAERDVPLRVVTVDTPALRDLYEASLVLVRPDHYVAWRGSQAPSDPLGVIDIVRGAAAPTADDDRPAPAVSAAEPGA